jgi:hypothetical protein
LPDRIWPRNITLGQAANQERVQLRARIRVVVVHRFNASAGDVAWNERLGSGGPVLPVRR